MWKTRKWKAASSVTPGCGIQEARELQLAQMNLNSTTAGNVQLCKIYSQDDNEKTPSLWVLCKRVFVQVTQNQWLSQPEDLVPLCKYLQFIDYENTQFLKKWIMIILWNLHSGTKSSGWLRHCTQSTELYLIYLRIALSNKRRSKKHGGFCVTGGYLADKECGVGVSWRSTAPLKQYKVNFSHCI